MDNFKYQGVNKDKNYFEGWYVKINDLENNHIYAFIFGISLYEKDPHAFIQIIDSKKLLPQYYRFNIKDFYYNNNSIKIGDNELSTDFLKINVDNFKIEAIFDQKVNLKKTLFNPGIMGFFKYLPLPTYHDIVFLNMKVRVSVVENKNAYNFEAKGYMEKNMGNRFPKKWLWAEANNFNNPNCYFVMAIADIVSNFKGFFCVLNIDNEEHRFATYNGYKVKIIKNEFKQIEIDFIKKATRLNVKIDYKNDYPIVAPLKNGKMKKIINESLNSILTFTLYEDNEIIVSDTSGYVGLENLY